MFGFLSSIFTSKKEKYSTASNIEEADVLYLGKTDRRTQRKMINSLDKKGLDTRLVYQEDIEFTSDEVLIEGVSLEELESEKKVIWRPNTFLNKKKDLEDVSDYAHLARSEKLDFTSDPLRTPLIGDKKKTKEILGSYGVETPESYDSLEEVDKALSSGKEVVKKNNFGKGGKDFEHIEDTINSFDENKLYEECIDHFSNNSVQDRRMYLVGGRVVSLAERRASNESFKPKNIDNGGYFTDVNEMNHSEINLAEKITESFGEGIYAVDYIKNENGEVKFLELNDTPGTKINRLDYNVDIFDEIAEYLEDPDTYIKKDLIAEDLREDLNITRSIHETSVDPFAYLERMHHPVTSYAGNNHSLAL